MMLPWQKRPLALNSPRDLPGLALWLDSKDVSSLRNDAGAQPVTTDGIKLASDKSGNSSTNVLCLNGVAGNYASAADSVPLSITGDIDIRAYATATAWTTATQSLADKLGAAGQRSYVLRMNSGGNGYLELVTSADGTAVVSATSGVIVPFANLSGGWVRATLDVNDGSGNRVYKFWTSTDGPGVTSPTWTQLGATTTTAGTTSIFDGTRILTIGSDSAGTASLFSGNVFRVQIRNNILDDGTGIVFDANFATAAKLAPSFTESSSNAATVTINTSGATGARISGSRDLYQGTAANQPIYLPWSGSNYGYLNGVSGNTITTPDNAAFAGATACDVRVWVVPSDVALGGKELFSQYFSAGNKRVFTLATDPITSTKIVFFCSQLGTPVAGVSSSVAATMSNGVGIGLRATWRASDGRVQFFTRSDFAGMPDSTGWTQLGTDQTIAGVASLYDSDQPFYIGGKQDQATNYPGRYLYADARVAIDGARIVCFDPAGYSSGQSFAGPTGETWTIASGATIVTRTCLYFDGSNDYLKAAAFSLSQPETVYFVGSQVTWTSGDYIYGSNATATDVRLRLFQFNTTPRLSNDTSGLGTNSGLALATNGIVSAIFDGASSSTRVNRAAAIASSSTTGATGGFTLGSAADGTAPANITAQEVLVYSGAHDKATQDRVIAYLANRNRIALT